MMEPPFPGMDPYLEAPTMWPDVHHRLITTIGDQLQAALAPRYRAVITPYATFESVEIAPVRKVVPDVVLIERDPTAPAEGDVAVFEPAPLTLPAVMEVEVEYARIEIYTVGQRTLVTAIELLAPANKRPGVNGADAYEQKRQEIFGSTVNLLELDLLRHGRRPQVARPLPDAPYFVFLSRVQRRPYIEIWPLSRREPIKLLPVPLLYPDPPAPLDLTAVIHTAYRRGRYDLDIDYHEPPPPPDLAADDAAWLDAHLRAHGLRP